MESFKEAWSLVSEALKGKMTDLAYTTWISRIEPFEMDFDGGIVTLLVPNDFHRQTILKSYNKFISDSISEFFGADFIIDYKITKDFQKPSDKPEKEEATTKDASGDFTFESFIIGSSNELAFAVAEAVAKNPSQAYNPLFIYGNSGLGKTHLLYAIGNYIKSCNKDADICYILGDEFANELIAAIGSKTTTEFHNKYRKVDVLLVDDVQFIGGKERIQEEFFHTFNALYHANKQIVLTSDRPPKEIKTLEDRLRSRFEQGFLADISPPDFETRVAIIKEKAEHLSFEISDDICMFIAEKLKNNIRQLEGVVKKLKAKYLLNHERPTLKITMECISDILSNDSPPELTTERIIDEVARTFNVSAEEIRSSKGRTANVSNARQIAIYITHELTNLPYVKIGEEFGKRHYTTIVYALQKTGEILKTNTSLKTTIDDIMKNIQSR